jgi:hypothetical protein
LPNVVTLIVSHRHVVLCAGFLESYPFLITRGCCYKCLQTESDDSHHKDSNHKDSHHKVLQQETVITVPSTLPADDNAVSDPTIGEVKEEEILITEREDLTVEILKEELEKNGVILPEW